MGDEDGGVYVSRAEARQWHVDDEIGGWAHMLFDHDRVKAGLWKAEPGDDRVPPAVEIPARETLLVLQGVVRVTIGEGELYELGVGDMLSIPPRSMVGWDPSPDCLVFWAYS
jgi:uncharacterized cupin superfamily protein